MTHPQKILIVKLSSIGDICHAGLTLPAIKANFPRVEITWLVEEKFKEVVEEITEVDHVVTINLSQPFKNFFTNIRKIIALRKTIFDFAFDMQGLLKSGILLGLARVKVGNKIGFASPIGRECGYWFYQKKITPPNLVNVADLNLELINRGLNISGELKLPTIKSVSKKPTDKLKIAINPWASFPTKTIPENLVGELCHQIYTQHNIKPTLIYSPDEMETAKNYAEKYQLELAPLVKLNQLYQLLSEFDFLIGTDSGPSYMTQLVGTPGVILFGPTNLNRQLPELSNEMPEKKIVGLYSQYQCPIIHPAPITKAYRCKNRNCPDNLCMKNFEVDKIIGLMSSQLKSN